MVTHAEEIKTGLRGYPLLSEGETNAESLLRSAADALMNVQRIYPKAEELAKRVEAAYIEIKDAREEAARRFEEVEFDPARQQLVEDRLSTIYGLKRSTR